MAEIKEVVKNTCRCALCLDWWVKMGGEEAGYGPFSHAEIVAAKEVKISALKYRSTDQRLTSLEQSLGRTQGGLGILLVGSWVIAVLYLIVDG